MGTIERYYDDAGRMATVKDQTGKTTTFDFDKNSNIVKTRFWTGDSDLDDVYAYNKADVVTDITYYDDNEASVVADLDYSVQADRMVNGEEIVSGLGGAADRDWGLSELGFIESENSVDNWGYDAADNLTRLQNSSGEVFQEFNTAGELCYSGPNQTPAAAPYADCNSVSRDGGSTRFEYDANGNRKVSDPAAGTPTNYSYDQANRLTSVETPTALSGEDGKFKALPTDRIVNTLTGDGNCDIGGSEDCERLTSANNSWTLHPKVLGVGGVPSSDVEAVTLTITAKDQNLDGFLKVYPKGLSPVPSFRSMSYHGGSENSTRVTVAAGDDGRVTISSNTGVDLYIEVHGYYTDSGGSGGSGFHAVTPKRVVDTRAGKEIGDCPTTECDTLSGNTTVDAQIAGEGPVPADAVAVAANVTVYEPGNDGYLKVYRAGTSISGIRHISYSEDQTTSNTGEFLLGTGSDDGRLALFSNRNVDVSIDIYGYYTEASGGAEAAFVPIDPTRVLKTVSPKIGICNPSPCDEIAASSTTDIKVIDPTLIDEDNVVAIAANITTFNGTGTTGAVFAYPNGQPRPPYRTAGVIGGEYVTEFAIINVGDDGKIEMYASGATGGVDIYIDVMGYYVSNTETTSYGYNADGLRTSKTTGSDETDFVWDYSRAYPLLVAETTGSDTTRYLYGPDNGVFETIEADGTVKFLHRDHLGNIRAETETDGTVTATTTYTPYGTPQTTGDPGRFGHAGEYTDPETGHQYLRARYYDPQTAQFLTVDPIVTQTRDPYGYANNNPTNYTDPLGLCGWTDPLGCGDELVDGAKKVADGVKNGTKKVGSAIKTGGDWVAENPGTVLTAASIAACMGTLVACGLASGIAFSARSFERIREDGWDESRNIILVDGAATLLMFSLVAAPASLSPLNPRAASFQALSGWQRGLGKFMTATPDMAGLTGGELASRSC